MSGAVVLVTWIGEASGSLAAAAAVACAGSTPDGAGLLVDLVPRRAPRPALVATAASRRLEERLAVHLPRARVASRGQICHLAPPPGRDGLGQAAAALALVRGSVGVVHLPPGCLQPALEEGGIHPSAALLRADLERDRSLAALASRSLIEAGLRVAALKAPLAWAQSRRALFGLLPAGSSGGLPPRLLGRLLDAPRGVDARLPLPPPATPMREPGRIRPWSRPAG